MGGAGEIGRGDRLRASRAGGMPCEARKRRGEGRAGHLFEHRQARAQAVLHRGWLGGKRKSRPDLGSGDVRPRA